MLGKRRMGRTGGQLAAPSVTLSGPGTVVIRQTFRRRDRPMEQCHHSAERRLGVKLPEKGPDILQAPDL